MKLAVEDLVKQYNSLYPYPEMQISRETAK